MKKSKACPKCGSEDILVVDGFCGGNGTGNHILLGVSILSAIPVDRYICCGCGYTEEWVRKADIPDIRKSRRVHK